MPPAPLPFLPLWIFLTLLLTLYFAKTLFYYTCSRAERIIDSIDDEPYFDVEKVRSKDTALTGNDIEMGWEEMEDDGDAWEEDEEV